MSVDIKTLYESISDEKHIFKNVRYLGTNANIEPKLYDKKIINGKYFTFIMPLKNRNNRANKSIESIVNEENSKYCDFIIVEDDGSDKLQYQEKYNKHITHYTVNTGNDWNRSKLLNYGIKRTNNELCVMCDADFIFPVNFVEKLIDYMSYLVVGENMFAIPSFETHKTNIMGVDFDKGDPYGNLWIYSTKQLKEIKGFNEKMKNHGLEERELKLKLKKNFKIDDIYIHSILEKI